MKTSRHREQRCTRGLSGALMVAVLAAASAFACSGCSRSDATVPVILISIDTLRAMNVSGYGYERMTTPNLDRFAAEAVVFRDAVCNSNNTLISHTSILTSLYPSVHRVEPGVGLDPKWRTLPQILADHGYESAFFAAHGDWLVPRYGFDRGVDEFRSAYVNASQIDDWGASWLERE